MPTSGWRNLRTSLSAFQTAGKTRPYWKVLRPVRGLNPLRRSSSYLSRPPKQCSGQVKRIGAPSRIRTYDTRFRKPLLYPLSYGG